MITEDCVSFETAKLLKEKGFNEPCTVSFFDKDSYREWIETAPRPLYADSESAKPFTYQRPTLQMAMKWLREIHNLDIIAPPQFDNIKWTYSPIIFKLLIPCMEIRLNDNKDKKEEAIEEGIKYCLKKLI